ncbi:MAG: Coenzyme F420 hydrogenase/dehydrogenase, beta subunit C-terminal domain [Proteobacteria bacterium]|nr:Coenzyme F420 hydrogenase/dehydrogenase, beta subunit C-terminal domain [Pseudomonadota bacterium]
MGVSIELNNISALKEILKESLENKVVDAVLGLFWDENKETVAYGMTKDVNILERLEVLCPSMPVQGARVVSNIKFTETPIRVLCIIKPCEMRAVVELVKLKQIMPEKLIFLSMDCGGALEPEKFKEFNKFGKDVVGEYLSCYENFSDFSYTSENYRFACRVCDRCVPKISDLRLRSYGKTKYLEALSDKGHKFLNETIKDGLKEMDFSSYEDSLKKIIDNRKANKDKERELFKKEINSIESFTRELSACIRCHNCMVNCPADYCKECIFRSPVFDHPSENYELWLERKGMIKLPSDTLLFHLTRLNHMSTSCVSCGMCETSCPVGIRLTRIFSFIGEETQKIFDYEPGRSYTEELPVATFREKELDKV